MRIAKQRFALVILTTAIFLFTFTYMYIFYTNGTTKVTKDYRKLLPINYEKITEQATTLALDSNIGNLDVSSISAYYLDTNATENLQTETSTPELTTPLPKSGLANNSLIGSFNESLSFVMNWPNKCNPENGKNLDVLIVVISAFQRREARDAIRKTWGRHALKRGAQIIFLVGKASKTEDSNAIIKENKKYRDMIQLNLDENYYNMSLKVIGMIKWTLEYCKNVKFVFKVDDDMFVNSELLLTFARANLAVKKTIIGSLWPGGQPIRTKGKWYVPMSLYPYPYYPTYVSGGAYLISGDSVPVLYETSLGVPIFIFEDVLLAGMVAEKAGVKRLHADPISVYHFKLEEICQFRKFISAHDYNPKMVLQVWRNLNRGDIKCSTDARKAG